MSTTHKIEATIDLTLDRGEIGVAVLLGTSYLLTVWRPGEKFELTTEDIERLTVEARRMWEQAQKPPELLGEATEPGSLVTRLGVPAGSASDFGYEVSRACTELQDRALRAWAERAGVTREALVRAGLIPRPTIEFTGEQLLLKVATQLLPLRERGESEEEYIDRVRRMPR